MGLGVEEFSRTVSRIHATPAASYLWQQMLSDLGGDLGAIGCTLLVGEGRERSIYSTSIDPEASAAYESYYGRLDFVAAACESSPVGLVNSGWGLVAANKRTEFHTDWQRRHGMTDGFLVRLATSTPASLFISAPPRDRPFETPERLTFVNALVPHLRSALAIRRQLGTHAVETLSQDPTAELVRHAVFVVGGNGRVAAMNTAAQQLAMIPDGLFVRNDHLQASTPATNDRLQAAINVALPGHATAARRSGYVTCVRPSGQRPYLVRVVPLDSTDDPGEARAAIVVIDPDRSSAPSRDLLKTLFGFTATEHEIAARLVDGYELKTIAADLGVSLSTVKTHLQRIFAKTQTHRQAELVRLLYTVTS